MTEIIGEWIVLKAVYLDPFSDRIQKTKIFIQQIDNKIADVAGIFNRRKIEYTTFLLRGIVAEWTSIHTNEDENIIFGSYKKFRKSFLERFMDSNPAETTIERLLNLQRRKMDIQEYITRALNLSYQTDLEDQIIKTLVFRRLYPKNQNRIMLVNSIKIETEFQKKSMEVYLKRIIRLLRYEEV